MTKDQFELICLNGSRARVDDYHTCNWGIVPSRAIVTSSATGPETRWIYQKFLEKAVRLFGKNNFPNNTTDPYANRESNVENRPIFDDNRYDSNTRQTTRNPNYNPNGYDFIDNSKNRDDNSMSVLPLELFNIFESAPRYGLQHNLLFSVFTLFGICFI